ncbi:unnamed protein product, partial [Rotaria magnacalcarata]
FNFVGRILGPRGMTAKQLEADTGCKIMVRGRGSMRDKQKEDQNRGKANWEHLDEELHVLIQCEDHENRALVKLERAKEEIMKLLKPACSTSEYNHLTAITAGVATRTSNNNAAGNVTQGAAASSASARYQPYTIQSPRLNRT